MAKILLETSAFLVPAPVLLLSCVDEDGLPNITSIAWASVACAVPPPVSVAPRPERASFAHISATKEFVLNVPPVSLVRAVDFCGMVSGRDVDKFAATGLTMESSIKVRPPMIAECPINLECVVRQSLELGSHVLFLAEVVALHADSGVVEDGAVIAGRVAPLAYDPFGGDYWSLKEVIAHQGFSEGTMPPGSAKRKPS
jgi:flavin reductase (DIM6/NTAB) family NADH-FMN oxidoreductase RutF